MQKGWRVVTSCKRLAEGLDLPCRCSRNYKHGRCEGVAARDSGLYTPEYARKVGNIILQELDHASAIAEAQGNSSLPSQFGEGTRRMCHEVSLPKQKQLCGRCILQSDVMVQGCSAVEGSGSGVSGKELEGIGLGETGGAEVDARVEPEGQGSGEQVGVQEDSDVESCQFNQTQAKLIEQLASSMCQKQQFQHRDCEQLLNLLPKASQSRSRGILEQPPEKYVTLGAYSYGNRYGVTKVTSQLPCFTRYILQYLQHHDPEGTACSSLVVNVNGKCAPHRDLHNEAHHVNRMIGLGKYSKGGLWIEIPGKQEVGGVTCEVAPGGPQVCGRVWATRHQLVKFPPKLWHGPEAWEGCRMTVTSYVTRGHKFLCQRDRDFLGSLGFKLPAISESKEEAQVVGHMGPRRHEDPRAFKERIKKQLYLLHSATGHGSLRSMVDMLKRRNVDPQVLALAQEFKCSVCAEKKAVQPRHLSSLEVLPPKWHTVSADVGHWRHPSTGEHVQFMLIIDEGSRFRVAKILSRGSKQQPDAPTCIGYLREGWGQYFGLPRTLRLDPAGAFRGQAVVEFCDREGIYLDHAPADAHWQIGICEQAVKGTKAVMDKLCSVDSSLSAEGALSTAVGVFNQRETIRGFSPVQHAFGRSPDSSGRLLESCGQVPDDALIESADQEFQKSAQLRAEAEKAHAEWNAAQRISRAVNSKPRPQVLYQPGDLVYFWRSQVSGQGRSQPGSKKGHFLGPARVLATETRQDSGGTRRAGNAIWCIRGRQLIKCAPEQLRPASEREELLEQLARDHGQEPTPWTFNKLAEEIGGNQFQDLTSEVPSEHEWLRAQDQEQEVAPVRFRFRGKRAAPETVEDEFLEQSEEAEPSSSSRPARGRGVPPGMGFSANAKSSWQDTVPEVCWAAEESSFWAEEQAAVEIEIPMPEDSQLWKKALNNFPVYFTGALKRHTVEVNEKRLTVEERQKFTEAKDIEVRNFLAAQAFEALPAHLQPSKDQAVNMRWVLTWKLRDDGSRKAKARAVLLGYQDPRYEFRDTTAPVMTKQTRQFLLQLAANEKWHVYKGDVSGAFLQGRPYPGEMYCVPCPEICRAMGLPPDSVTRLRKACYGLVEAPLEWYRTISEFLESLGLVRIWSDACCWVWRDQGRTQGVVSGHVDDFLFSGNEQNPRWLHIIAQIQQKFKWGDWEKDHFTQCGVQVQRQENSFVLSQTSYVSNVAEIPVNSSRRKNANDSTTAWEKSKLRALLGP